MDSNSPARVVCVDTETTGKYVTEGDRIIEIGCVEIVDGVPTGVEKQWYVNPERAIDQGAFEVHGISDEMVRDKPTFEQIAGELLEFLQDSTLVIHNAEFDVPFINVELARAGLEPLPNEICDTLVIARRRYPGAKTSLDSLCRKLKIDRSERTKHGALVDARILGQLYVKLVVQGSDKPAETLPTEEPQSSPVHRRRRALRPVLKASEQELAAHSSFLEGLKSPLWLSA